MDEFVQCIRCGTTFLVNRKRKKLRMHCDSCRVTRATTIQQGDFKCLPWHGRFDNDMTTPIDDNGEQVIPGERLCGNLDCVNSSHVKGK
jgi:hypothetical protein